MSACIGERREPVARCVFIALFAGEHATEHAISPFGGYRPGTIRPGRVVADMLVVTAFEFGDPMLFGILKESNDALVHEPRATPVCLGGWPCVFYKYLRVSDDTIAAEYSAREEANEVLVRTIVFVEAFLPKLRHRRISKRPIHLQPADQDVAPRSR